jgi:alpha-L-arabinofuranosidase
MRSSRVPRRRSRRSRPLDRPKIKIFALVAFRTLKRLTWSRIHFDFTGLVMKRFGVSARWALAFVGCAAMLTGCGGGGGSSSSGGGGSQTPTVTSFTASAAEISAGSSTTLTAVFSGGTGVVTPGNLTIVSGTPLTVSPTVTTTYTITVTATGGGSTTQTVTVKVDPVITSFSAGSAEILAGSSTTLTAVFAGGTGVVTPGNLTILSGTPLSVTPAVTTTYTITVTPPGGTAVTQQVTVKVDPVITSFTASSNPITSGSSTDLTAVFGGGIGVITPGNLTVTSGTPVPVTPTATTTYTLTVTPPVGTTVTKSLTVTVSSSAAITNFYANPTSIQGGSSTSLYAYFTGGTGVITPGNLPVTSGTPVSVSPSTTTTYTLTVTPTGGGTAITKTATVSVYSITSFTANPNPVVTGSSTQLTAVFAGGTAVVTPGNVAVTSGTPITVNPTLTTTYTLTLTPTTGNPVTQALTVNVEPTITVDLSSKGPAITDQLMGMNMAAWYDIDANKAAINTAFQAAGIKALRWPGGSQSDIYHWQTNSVCSAYGGYAVPNSNYLNFINDLEIPGGYDIALTANYGTNATCNGGGDPTEAANWVAYAYANGGTVSHVTVGNESYGTWEVDLHAKQHDPTTYAASVVGANGYYALIKAQSSNTKVGVVVEPNVSGWDSTVLANAKGSYDFVEYHFYPQNPGQENDTTLVQQAAQTLTANIKKIQTELQTVGESNIPIYVGEIGSVSSKPGKQSWSITQGLYAGQVLGEFMNDGIARATWWIGFGNCNTNADGNVSASLYGWQNWGAYNVFSDGPSDTACPNAGPIGTMSPTAQAYNLFQQVAVAGEFALAPPTVAGDTTSVRAYAATHSGGTALMLFNLNQTTPETVVVTLSGISASSDVKMTTYDKALYDQTNSSTPVWAPPTSNDLGAQTMPLTLTLPPWSMNVVLVK